LCDLTEGLRLLTVLLHPFMPATAAEMSARIGLPAGSPVAWDEAAWGRLPAGLRVVAGASLFPRIEE
ncbi:MAG: methionine--tRNA ligase, partial [Thermoleophilia bacterium]|nr:methionine--tRNA ligase [Thermoleophilia bacterium]